VKYCVIFLRSGETMYSGEMEDDEAAKLQKDFKEQTPGILEFQDEEGVFLLRITDVVCVCCNKEQTSRAVGFTKTDTP